MFVSEGGPARGVLWAGLEAVMAVRKNESMGFADAALDGLGSFANSDQLERIDTLCVIGISAASRTVARRGVAAAGLVAAPDLCLVH